MAASQMEIQVLNFAKICRTCLNSERSMKLLFPKVGDTAEMQEIRKMLAECTIYPMSRDDHLPNNICSKCINRIKVAYEFKTQCERAYEMLTSVMQTYHPRAQSVPSYVPSEIIIIDENGVKTETECIVPTAAHNPESLQMITGNFATETVNLDDDEYKCELCPKNFSQEVHLRKHMSSVHPAVGYVCNICNKNCGSLIRLKKHHSLMHPEAAPITLNSDENIVMFSKCNDCMEEFETQDDLKNHTCKNEDNTFDPSNVVAILGLDDSKEDKTENTSHYDDNNYTFEDINNDESSAENESEIENDDDNDSDQKSEFEKPAPKSRKKSFNPPSSPEPTRKSKRIKSKKENKCNVCNKTFSRATHLRRHKLTHTQEKPFACKECNKSFARADHLKLHKFNHSKPYLCSVCNRGFSRKEHLRRHEKNRHEPEGKVKTDFCQECGKGFTTAKYLTVHMKTHRDRKWKCKFCPEVFDSKAKSTEHGKTHAHEKPYLCSECGLRFVRNDYLIIHMRRHKGEKPYKCKFCNKGFPRATDLNVHERYHTGEKSHLCTVCGKGFQRAYNLLVHTRIHTGEKPYKCPHCPKRFTQGNDMKSHIRRHTGERFKCNICDEGFIQAYHLTQHKRAVHGIDAPSHIRRVEKFVTPKEQKQQMEAIRQQHDIHFEEVMVKDIKHFLDTEIKSEDEHSNGE